jgi:GST-like protein
MSSKDEYLVPDIWTWEEENGGTFGSINRPVAGASFDKELPIGEHPLQLYSQGTPNGVKVTILLEELLEVGYNEAEYDAWLVNIGQGDQFSSGFVEANPNSKIPALVDYSEKYPQRIFESGSILFYLATKFGSFLPSSRTEYTEMMSWLFWQMGSAPYLGGGFGHFFVYAPKKLKYPIDRYSMEVKRQLSVLDNRLKDCEFVSGSTYSIADMAIWPWYGRLALGRQYGEKAGKFLNVSEYTNIKRWAKEIETRAAVKRGKMVNRTSGDLSGQLRERHSKQDFKLNTEDKISQSQL